MKIEVLRQSKITFSQLTAGDPFTLPGASNDVYIRIRQVGDEDLNAVRLYDGSLHAFFREREVVKVTGKFTLTES